MRELRPVPTDRWGIPRPLIPSERLAELPFDHPDSTEHHEFFLPGRKRFHDAGAVALRAGRISRAEKKAHSTGPRGLHPRYNISDVPESEESRVSALILTYAAYYPEEGLDLSADEPLIRPLEAWEKDILCELDPEDNYDYRYLRTDRELAAQFIRKFVLKKASVEVERDVLHRFIGTPKLGKTLDDGEQILHSAVEVTARDVSEDYQRFRELGLLHPSAPISAEAVVFIALRKKNQMDLLQPLKERLSQEVLLAA